MAVEFGSMALPPVPSAVQAPLLTTYGSPASCGAVSPPLGVTFRPSPRITIDFPAAVSSAGGNRCAVPSKLPDPSASRRSQPPDRSGIAADCDAPCALIGALQPVRHTAKSSAPGASRGATRIRNCRLPTIETITADYR